MKDLYGNDIRCSEAGKVCYTAREAGTVINETHSHHYGGARRLRSKTIPKRKYVCPDCGYYHVTHHAFFADSEHQSHRRRCGLRF